MNRETKFKIYYAYIYSTLNYLVAFWEQTTKNINDMQVTENKPLKVLFCKHKGTHYFENLSGTSLRA